ncbi:hypothetical protein LCGC14_2865050 [marine sediment metagenome]|uniref:Uncharacterized protein n=1 Tax=marine sediment metagenome TaxID=412755 RepID=A0A0F9ACT0_9ZZZZ
MSYKIIRYYKNANKPKTLIKKGLTLEQAQKHCKKENTHCLDWFDGYIEE